MPKRIEVAYVRTIEPEAPPREDRRRRRGTAAAPGAPRAAAPRPAAAASAGAAAPAVVAQASAPESSAPGRCGSVGALPTPRASWRPRPRSRLPPCPRPPPRSEAPGALAARGARHPAHRPRAAFEWPASTRLSYVLTGNYRGEVSGSAQVEWIRVDDHYQVNLDLVIGPELAPLITRRMTSEGNIAASGLVPTRYDEDTQVVMRDRRRVSVVFEADAVVLANGQRRERLEGVQDTASQFIQMTYVFSTQPERLHVGGAVEFPLALPRAMDSYVYEVVEAQTLQTPFGPLASFHLKPRPRPTPRPNQLTVELWIAPTLRYLPVRIRIEQDAATFIDLMISGKPEMAAPAAVLSAEPKGKPP